MVYILLILKGDQRIVGVDNKPLIRDLVVVVVRLVPGVGVGPVPFVRCLAAVDRVIGQPCDSHTLPHINLVIADADR